MKARITELVSEAGSEPLVRLETPAGSAVLRARTQSTQLVCGTPVTVEFEINELMTMGLNTKPATTRRCALEDRDGRVLMTGLVDAIDLDGLVYFRLGTDCLIMLEAAPGQFEVGSWLDLDLDAASVVAYL